MSNFEIVMSLAAECNLKLSVYGAFGAALFMQGLGQMRESREEARACILHGLTYCSLGLL